MRKKLENKGRPVDRIRSLADWMIEHKVLKSHYAFEKVCGLSTYYLRNLSATEKGNPGVDTICKIYTTFPHVNLEWLVTGEGRMFRQKNDEKLVNDIRMSLLERLM